MSRNDLSSDEKSNNYLLKYERPIILIEKRNEKRRERNVWMISQSLKSNVFCLQFICSLISLCLHEQCTPIRHTVLPDNFQYRSPGLSLSNCSN